MDYFAAVDLIASNYKVSTTRAAELLDIELLCSADDYVKARIKSLFEQGWLSEHDRWLKRRIKEVLTEILIDQFLISKDLLPPL
jgi:predicted HTH domain antitoxin